MIKCNAAAINGTMEKESVNYKQLLLIITNGAQIKPGQDSYIYKFLNLTPVKNLF